MLFWKVRVLSLRLMLLEENVPLSQQFHTRLNIFLCRATSDNILWAHFISTSMPVYFRPSDDVERRRHPAGSQAVVTDQVLHDESVSDEVDEGRDGRSKRLRTRRERDVAR